jgi:hypothetical protein
LPSPGNAVKITSTSSSPYAVKDYAESPEIHSATVVQQYPHPANKGVNRTPTKKDDSTHSGSPAFRGNRGMYSSSSSSPGARKPYWTPTRSSRRHHGNDGSPSRFVISGRNDKIDDPFISPSKSASSRSAKESVTTGIASRSPDKSGPISPENAQARLLPSACIFVAK